MVFKMNSMNGLRTLYCNKLGIVIYYKPHLPTKVDSTAIIPSFGSILPSKPLSGTL